MELRIQAGVRGYEKKTTLQVKKVEAKVEVGTYFTTYSISPVSSLRERKWRKESDLEIVFQ